jgi:hypothetical protein
MAMDETLSATKICGAAYSRDLEDSSWHEVTYLRSKLDFRGVIKIHEEYNNARGKSVEAAPTHGTLRSLPDGLSEETQQIFARLHSVTKLADTRVDR